MAEESVFAIDKHRLDEECERQPLLMHEMAVLQADEEDREATAKADMELVEAEVELLVRQDPTKFIPAGTKVTETLIASLVKVSKRFQQAQRAYLAAKHSAATAKAGVSGAEHRKRMIEKLVELQGRDYFAAPSVKGENRERMSEASKKTTRTFIDPIISKKKRRET